MNEKSKSNFQTSNALEFDLLIVGAGFAGITIARSLADAGYSVCIIEKRDHIGGNAYDKYDEHGVLIHPYGPHIFHTNSDIVWNYLSEFTEWRAYEHKVRTKIGNKYYPIPINRTTINSFFQLDLDETEIEKFLDNLRFKYSHPKTSEEVVLGSVGQELCDAFFRGYTRKQWGLDLSELSPGVAARIPTRTNDDDRYFTDRFQAMPRDGYSVMFKKMVDHRSISVFLNCNYFNIKGRIKYRHLVYTGPIDAFFDFEFGKLPYRSLRFEHEHLSNLNCYQDVGTINFPNEYDFTRITEFKHLTGQLHPGTSIVREYPAAEGDPFYPVPRKVNEDLFQKYKNLTLMRKDVTFVGRLAEYRYYNMDQVVAAALKEAEKIKVRFSA